MITFKTAQIKINMIKYLFATLILFSTITSIRPSRMRRIKRKFTSYVFRNQLAWPILCKNTSRGNVPGKLDDNGGAYYPFGGEEHRCTKFKALRGSLASKDNSLPDDCEPKGFQTNDNNKYYNAIIQLDDGLIPGKAAFDLSKAWYSWDGDEIKVTEDFYILC